MVSTSALPKDAIDVRTQRRYIQQDGRVVVQSNTGDIIYIKGIAATPENLANIWPENPRSNILIVKDAKIKERKLRRDDKSQMVSTIRRCPHDFMW